MKYNEALYNLCISLNRNERVNIDLIAYAASGDALLDLIILKFALSDYRMAGIVKFNIDNDTDRELYNMINQSNINNYVKNYSIYTIKNGNGSYSLVWNYMAYYNYFNALMAKFDYVSGKTREELANAFEIVKNLPPIYRNIVINMIIYESNVQKETVLKDEAIRKCRRYGHKFSDWEKHHVVNRELDLNDYPQGYKMVERDYWERTCKCCGFREITSNDPKLVDFKTLKKKK